jgi:hypothetical protein
MRLLTVAEFATLHGISTGRVRTLLGQGRVPEAQRVGRAWVIPEKHSYTPGRAGVRYSDAKKDSAG